MTHTVAVDTETTGTDAFRAGALPFMVGLFTEDEQRLCWEWEVNPRIRQPRIPKQDREEICHHLEWKNVVFHNADFDLRMLAAAGIRLMFRDPMTFFRAPHHNKPTPLETVVRCDSLHDTILMSHCAGNNGADGSHGLKELAFHYLNIPPTPKDKLHTATIAARRLARDLDWKLGTDHKGEAAVEYDYWMPHQLAQQAGEDAWIDICRRYNLQDAYLTLGLFFFLQERLQAEGLWPMYERERLLLPVTYNMEHVGMHLLPTSLKNTATEFRTKAASSKRKAEKLIREQTGQSINLNSSRQLIDYFQRIEFPILGMTSKGNPSVDETTLRNMAQYAECHDLHDAATVLRRIVGYDPNKGDEDHEPTPGYRAYVSGQRYLDSYAQLCDDNYYLHPSFNQCGVKFTRYSSSRPNGQNVSKRALIPLRKVYGPPPNHVWYSIDYSQLELRIFATAANDRGMLDAFARGEDFHGYTAKRMFNSEDISSEQRRYAKAVNFKCIYGGLKNTPPQYAEQFPSAASFMQEVEQRVRSDGYVTTLDGYRLWIDPERPYVGVDAICQGTAGRIVKEAMIRIHQQQLVDWTGSAIIANIHDELIFQFHQDYPHRQIIRRIAREMEAAGFAMGVRTPVDCKVITTNWAEGRPFALHVQENAA